MSEALRLRTMARKSVFSEGKFEGYSVQQVLDLKGHNTLRFYYYNCSMISFLPDILDEINIKEQWRIEKPGTDPEKFNQLREKINKSFNVMLMKIGEDNPGKAIAMRRNYKKNASISARDKMHSVMNEDRKYFSKGSMQRRNHGHF